MAGPKSKKAKTVAKKRKPPIGSKKVTSRKTPIQTKANSGARTAVQFDDAEIEKYLSSGEHSGLLEDYFGEEAYRELTELAQEASARSVRGGPRVFIDPGIMGSKLGKKRKLLSDVIWLDPIDIAAGNLAKLRLNGDDPKLGALGVILFAYLKMKLRLRAAGYHADFHPYDWRKSVSVLGKELSQRIRGEAKDVSIVAHSLGGLVTRSAIAQKAPRVKRVVMLGTPNHGSFATVQVLRGIYPILRKLAFIDVTHDAEELVNIVFGTFPSLYEMLPWPEKFSTIDLYNRNDWPLDGPDLIPDQFQSARKVQMALAPGDERFTLIAGVNHETIVNVRKVGNEFEYDLSGEGDGTVALSLAELPGAKTYFIDESHGSLPNNRTVAKAVDDILATGTTQELPDQWRPSRAGVTRMLKDRDYEEIEFEGSPGRALSLREQRLLLDEVVSAASRDAPALPAADSPDVAAAIPGIGRRAQRIVIGRRYQHRIEIRLAHGSITDVDAHAYVLGMFRDVTPAGAAGAIDALLDGTISEFITRRMFNGSVGEIGIIPTGRHPVRPNLIAFAGLGTFDKFNNDVLELVAENILRTFLRTKVDDFATVLFGGASGIDPEKALEHMLIGFIRGLLDGDIEQRFHGITLCEANQQRYNAIKQGVYRLSSTELFDEVEVTVSEVDLPPMVERKVWGVTPKEMREPVYLIVRCSEPEKDLLSFESSILTSGAKATVMRNQKEVRKVHLQRHLDKITQNTFTFPRLDDFGETLVQLVLAPDVSTALTKFPEHQLVVVHNALASLVPWETIKFGYIFPAAAGGLSRRYLADNLSVAKWLENRKYGTRLDVLLVVNPTEDLPGAAREGKRIQELFGNYVSAVNLTVLEGAQARKGDLKDHFGSGDFDVVHYAGHAFFDPRNPDRSGILCAGKEVLSGAELAGMGNLPALMFFNACEAARIRKPKNANDPVAAKNRIQRNVGLAEAFMRGGVANYMGTYWPVSDDPAKRFAEVFYDDLLQGKSIGKSLLDGRKELQKNHWVDWADYVFYGSPDFVLKMPRP